GRRAAPLLVVLVAAAAYAATLGYDLVWDDTLLIQQSWRLHHWRELPSLLTSHFWSEVGEASHYYRPLVTLTFFLDMQVWGLRPFGFHLTNVLAHAAVTLAVLAVARRATGGELAAAICALVFALHPLHTESVSFVSGRTDVIATLFFLLALLAYDRGRDRDRRSWAAWSLGAYLLALLAKEVAITLPIVLVLWDRLVRGDLQNRRALWRAAARYAPYGAVTGLYLGLRVFALGGFVDSSAGAWGPLLARALTTLKIVAAYVWITIVPYPTSTYHAIVPETVPPGLTWWLAAAGLVGAFAATAWAVRRAPAAGFGALWFWITLAPSVAVNLLPLPSPLMAERFLYLPTVGFCLVLGWTASRLLGPVTWGRSARVRPAPSLALAGVLLAYAVLTLWRNDDWRDEYRLYSRMVETSPGAAIPHINLAFSQLPRGEVGPANQHLREAVRLAPGNPKAHAGLGLTETILGNREAGLRHGQQARALAPGNADVLASLGALYLHRGEPARALPELTESLRIKPNQVHAALNRALALAWLDQPEAAEAQLERALALVRLMSPDLPLADRITAEVTAGRDSARARAAWARYIARLRVAGQLDPALAAELGRAERQLFRGECGDDRRRGTGGGDDAGRNPGCR
ncbi:MAG: tetratricopeptide repeat protein, partial [Candidatus Rokuibacteriota bacterium]